MVAAARTDVRRAADSLRNRVLWLVLGLSLGALSSLAVQAFALNGRLATLEAEVRGLRRDLDRMKP